MITVARRSSDGLLADIQSSPALPVNPTARINNAIAQFGGAAGDWGVVEIPTNLWSSINGEARQFASLVNGAINGVTQSNPPLLTSDQTQIQADGSDVATLTCDVGDANFSGAVTFRATAPDGSRLISVKNAVAGVATETLTTTQEGVHQIQVETVLHGIAFVNVEGI